MPMIDLDEKTLEELAQEEENEDYELVEEGEWNVEHKYCYCHLIIKHKKSGKHYRFGMSRHGSYYDGYEFEYDPSGEEVEQKERVVKEWVRVKK